MTSRDRAAGEWFAKLVALQERLCASDGCPWDREQTHASLRKYLIEETYEVLDAMQSGDGEDFASELGDLMLQIVFHSVLAEAAGRFTISDVIEAIFTKMVRRHPHVFGDATAATSGVVLKKWEELKAKERAEKRGAADKEEAAESVLAGVPRSLPGVLEAYQLTRRASHIGFDWDSLQGIFDKIEEEKRELAEFVNATPQTGDSANSGTGAEAMSNSARKEEEVGDLLFATVNVARFLGVDPEIALKKANRKFKERFQWMESAAARENRRLADVPRKHMEEFWNQAKNAAVGR
ncbi:MAG TPA: nucleoside triphosphate pyrophosphohydrolase [Candidatus Acidoferrales bacterium]|nr:nucleoside triphosphate pyrophosphohydrolase [Candidatus Acidoferrales bacterium]